ncbi:glycosyltransferase family 2 protein (plasmid) [Escherichia coli]|uniref:glycosyltransferase family 2 protein n=1 Tax=Escherichia coli TaxID=562 RepID=UPI00351CE4F9
MHSITSESSVRVAICAIFKNEKPYILEWLSHHRMLGITDFYIADNISSDGSSELLDSLHHDGLITRLSWPTLPGIKPQLPAYEKLAELAKSDGVVWALFIDADEFITLNENLDSIQAAIQKITEDNNEIAGITINWATYGSSKIIINPEHNVLGNFEYRFKKDSNINRHYKSLIKLHAFVSSGNTPHEFKIKDSYKYINTIGQEHSGALSGMSENVTWENIKINHYMIKSKSEYVSKKMKKGRASSNANLDLSYFYAHDNNEEYSPINRSWIHLVKYQQKKLQNKYDNNHHVSNEYPSLYYVQKHQHIGNIDSVQNHNQSIIEINGWALSVAGKKPECFRVVINECIELEVKDIKFKLRPDVFSKIDLCNDESCGFTLLCNTNGETEINSLTIYHGSNYVIASGAINYILNK